MVPCFLQKKRRGSVFSAQFFTLTTFYKLTDINICVILSIWSWFILNQDRLPLMSIKTHHKSIQHGPVIRWQPWIWWWAWHVVAALVVLWIDTLVGDPKRFTHLIEIIAVLCTLSGLVSQFFWGSLLSLLSHYYPCRIVWVQHIKCTVFVQMIGPILRLSQAEQHSLAGTRSDTQVQPDMWGRSMVQLTRSMVAMAFLVGFKMDSRKVPRVWANVNMWNWAKVKCESLLIVETPFCFRTPPHHTTSSAEMLDAFLGLYHAV